MAEIENKPMPGINSHLKTLSLFTGFLFCFSCTATETSDLVDEFDCVAVFDLVAGFAAPNCPHQYQGEDADPEITDAINLLKQYNFTNDSSFENVSVKFCPLSQGLGLVRRPNVILLDDGLRLSSRETLAEVLIHELEHVKQMNEMGAEKFKCSYVMALLACSGCMDNNHALEAPAYATQARVREFLLKRWLEE